MSNDATLVCGAERRRDAVRAARNLNGLDYLEVVLLKRDDPARGVALVLFFLGKAPDIVAENVQIRGGRRIRDISVTDIDVYRQDNRERDDAVMVYVDKQGDFSTYTLRLVELDERGHPTDRTLAGFDPRYDRLDFSFKAFCSSDLDCKTAPTCAPEPRQRPEISYLAKDYASFRQLILDRLALIMPDWKERHVPDIGITLVELLAYVGDYLSYYQDAVATEAYLDTARQRISVRRHARLVDYPMHEGCNARAWVAVEASQDETLDAEEVYFTTTYPGARVDGRVLSQVEVERNAPADAYEVFEPLLDTQAGAFAPADLREPEALAARLKHAQDPLARYVRGQLSPDTLQLVDADEQAAAPELIEVLLADLNRLLFEPRLYDEQRFAGCDLSPDSLLLIGVRLRGKRLRCHNRRLLEQAFPDEIRQSGKLYFYRAHNQIALYSWGDQECCLPRGTTTATLLDGWEVVEQPADPTTQASGQGHGHHPPEPPLRYTRKLRHLRVGDVLVFEERIGPKTGVAADADLNHRQAVRLTRVEPVEDELFRIRRLATTDPATGHPRAIDVDLPTPVVEIAWAPEDALTFPLCLSAIGPAPECALLENISIACGNVVLVDHGRRVEAEQLGRVPIQETAIVCVGEDSLSDTMLVPGRFRPRLSKAPLTFSQTLVTGAPAASLIDQDPRQALPWIRLLGPADPPIRTDDVIARPDPGDPQINLYFQRWSARRDLLASQGQDPHFAVEVDDDGRAYLRFGDGELGMPPEAGAAFEATYRVGNGPGGNVGAETIVHLVLRRTKLSGVSLRPRNPLPATGGQPPEPVAEVKLFAPGTFRAALQRAITADDYAQIVMREFGAQVQRAAASLRWNGSRYVVWVAIDQRGSEERDQQLLDAIAQRLERYRRIGHDLVVEQARYVPLDVALKIVVRPHYLRGHVEAALLDRLSNRLLPDGSSGFFNPDNLTFGDGIYLSTLVAAAQAVTGVEAVEVLRLERRFDGPNGEIESGLLPLGPLEVARLDNDPSYPENGRLILTMEGGR
jgi:hypothetical protein